MSKHAKSSTVSFHPLSAPDFLPLPQLRDLQLRRLQAIVQRAYDHVALFHKRMDERGLAPQDVRALDDVAKLPFADKTDLRDTYPFGLFASPMKEIVRLHASSGTTGKPIVVAYTQEDVQVWTNVMLRSFAACGLHEGDVIQNAYGYGLFTGGLGAHYGAEALGATVIPISGGNTPRQLMVMKDFGVTAICCTPSYFIHLIERAGELGVDVKKLPLRAGVFGAEPWSEAMRRHIESHSNVKAYDIYGLSEIIGPGVAIECVHQAGLHIFEDHFYPEIVDPETGKPVPPGREGELVLTTLSKWAMPMIRYRTHDITSLIPEPCACGRTIRRMTRIARRSDDMFIVRGVNVFPSQIESVLGREPQLAPHYLLEVRRPHSLDEIDVLVEMRPELSGQLSTKDIAALAQKTQHLIKAYVGITATVNVLEPGTIERSQGKAKRVIDRRPKS